jgi:hypothetical protein
MDPLTHVVVGRAVVAAADAHQPALRGVAWAAALGALSPDIDAAVAFAGWDRYVRVHEAGTHSILGALVMAGLTAAVVTGVARIRDVRSARRAGPVWPLDAGGRHLSRPLPARAVILLAAATVGAMSHLVLDVGSGARVRLGWPIAPHRVTLPLVAMADPWLIAICVGGLAALWPGRRPLRTVSRTLVVAAIVLFAVKGALLARALRTSGFGDTPYSAVEARWGALSDWQVFERTPALVRAWAVSSGGAPPAVVVSQALGPDTPLVRASRSLESVRNFLAVHEFTFPVERQADAGRTEVLWSDLRYCWSTAPDDAPEVRAGGSTSCGVWAGGLFGPDGAAITQLVRIGAVTQTRPAPR